MRSAKWLPSSIEENELFIPSDLYQRTNSVERILSDKVDYVSPTIRNVDFLRILGVEGKIEVVKFMKHFKRWSTETSFITTTTHIHHVYDYLKEILAMHIELVEELEKTNCIFLPNQQHELSEQKVRREDQILFIAAICSA